ncbi:Enkuring domain-containig protein [Trypanosoma equiperdum]|uniref:Enkurin domain-containing protein n=2 Tax=Trypanozoon TaxID=39700 RepID=Q4GZB9_TRYB2|nr:hypothetical protein, conserved [Trypanosoma brucei brucei TREU927]CAJ16027.1 hypothetical protein, conserved [Trypanosoma brucei brucei TREU927]SCU71580.1 Enkuring domain-containig protein [Trypanosoma equiperdum]
MSGENIKNLLAPQPTVDQGPYSGKYEKRMVDLPKPTYSTFYNKNKEFDSTHPRYFKQRDAVIGPIVNDTVDPKNFLRTGQGIKHIVPPVPHKKQHRKDFLDCGDIRKRTQGAMEPADQQQKESSGMGGMGSLANTNGVGGQAGDGIREHDMSSNDPERKGEQANGGDTGLRGTGNVESAVGSCDNKNNFQGAATGDNGRCHLNSLDRSRCKKDFVTSNIIDVDNMVPKRRKDQPEDPTRRKTFGRVPGYIGRVKEVIEKERMQLKAIGEARTNNRLERVGKFVYRLDEQERLNMISKLRAKLTEKGAELNRMPFAKDTYIQMKRKSDLEKRIKEIESSLEKLEKDAVFIYSDDPRVVHWTKDAAFEEARLFASD